MNIDKKKYDMVDEGKDVEIKAYSVTIEPMYVGRGKDKRLENVVNVRLFDTSKGGFNELQAIVPPKSRLDMEVKKLLKVCNDNIEKMKA